MTLKKIYEPIWPIDSNDLVIKSTISTPLFHFKQNGQCIISGNSRPEDVDGIFKEAKVYLIALISQGVEIEFIFDYDYFNSCTQRYNYELLEILSNYNKIKKVTWYYLHFDEYMEEMGEIYKNSFQNLNIKLKAKK